MKPSIGIFLLLLSLAWVSVVRALEIHQIEVDQQKGVYQIRMEVGVAAQVDAVRKVLTDYKHLDRINPAVLESRILAEIGDYNRVRTVTKLCVLFYCRRVVQTQDMKIQKNGDLVAEVLPEFSDFSQGRARWHFRPTTHGTRMIFEGKVQPAFWIPPIVGPWVVQQMLLREALITTTLLEQLAAENEEK